MWYDNEEELKKLLDHRDFYGRTREYLQELVELRGVMSIRDKSYHSLHLRTEGLLKILAACPVCPVSPPILGGERFCEAGGDCCERCWRVFVDVFDREEK